MNMTFVSSKSTSNANRPKTSQRLPVKVSEKISPMAEGTTTTTTTSGGSLCWRDYLNIWKLLVVLFLVKELYYSGANRASSPSFLQTVTTVKNNSTTLKEAANNNNNEYDYFEQIVPHSGWCPYAKCSTASGNSTTTTTTTTEQQQPPPPLCNLCEKRFLIVLALGRTASTTLTWTLDALPGVRMGGENAGVINQFHDLFQGSVWEEHFRENAGKKNTPWGHGAVGDSDLNNMYCSAQQFIQSMYPPYNNHTTTGETMEQQEDDIILGFKTVRFIEHHKREKDLSYIHFLTSVFPCARFVVNIRSDVQALMHSQRTSFGRDGAASDLDTSIERMLEIHTILGQERSYLLDSTEWTKNVTALNGFVRWLGYSSPECDFQEVLELNTVKSYSNGKEELDHGLSGCRYIGGV